MLFLLTPDYVGGGVGTFIPTEVVKRFRVHAAEIVKGSKVPMTAVTEDVFLVNTHERRKVPAVVMTYLEFVVAGCRHRETCAGVLGADNGAQ